VKKSKVTVNISAIGEQYCATLETKKGHRYYAIYAHPVSEDDVIEDFKNCKSSFHHVN